MNAPLPSSSSKKDGVYVVQAPQRGDHVAGALRSAYGPPAQMSAEMRRIVEKLRLLR